MHVPLEKVACFGRIPARLMSAEVGESWTPDGYRGVVPLKSVRE